MSKYAIKGQKLHLAWQYRPENADFPPNVSASLTSTGPRAEYRGPHQTFYLAPGYWLIIPLKGEPYVLDDLAASQLLEEVDEDEGTNHG